MGIRAASPTPQELPLSNWTWFNAADASNRQHGPSQDWGLPAPLLEKHADDLRALVASQPGITLREIKALAARGFAVTPPRDWGLSDQYYNTIIRISK